MIDSRVEHDCDAVGLLVLLAIYSGDRVIVAVEDLTARLSWRPTGATLEGPLDTGPQFARQILATNGFRVLEQRFPRSTYVVIRDEGATR